MHFFSGPINALKEFTSARGNKVPFTAKDHLNVASLLSAGAKRKNLEVGTPLPWKALSPMFTDSVTDLDLLLRAEPVNLSQVSKEIRAHPDLEVMIMRLGGSLALPLDTPPCTIEEATIALGTDRLRVLMYALSLLKEGADQGAQLAESVGESSGDSAANARTACIDQLATRFAEAENLETLYLAGFLHWLGLDSRGTLTPGHTWSFSQSGVETAHASGLTDVFMQDFVTLIPFLGPTLAKPVQKMAARTSDRKREEKAE
jgi:hypothetical protein